MQVTQEGLAAAVLAVMQRDGLDKVNMRAVASELDVRAPSLDFHVRDKNALLELAADALIPATTPSVPFSRPEPRSTPRASAGRCTLRGTRRRLPQPAADPTGPRRDLLDGRFGSGPRSLAATEAGLALLVDEGFHLDAAAQALFLVFSVYTVGFVAAEQVPMNAAEARGARRGTRERCPSATSAPG